MRYSPDKIWRMYSWIFLFLFIQPKSKIRTQSQSKENVFQYVHYIVIMFNYA